MEKLLPSLLIAALSVILSGCGSFMAAMQSETIEEDPGKRTFGQQLDDENIETKAVVNIHAVDEAFDEAHIIVISYNGYVLIAGQVQTEALKTKATEVVRKIRDVRRIYNELDVSAPSSAISRTSDTWITTKVKSWLLGSSEIQGGRVKVVTENGTVFLMGLASQAEEKRIVKMASEISGVQRVVSLIEVID
ncbi:MAG: osmotically-inducible protein OsmY [Halioglobus sp.]|jgi:osmotically-inducible protein OsmY